MNITIEFFKIYYIYNHHVGKKKNIGHKVNDKVSFWCDPSNYRQKKQITAPHDVFVLFNKLSTVQRHDQVSPNSVFSLLYFP